MAIIRDQNMRNGKDLLLQRMQDVREGQHRDLTLDVGLKLTNENGVLYRGALVLMVGETGSGKSSVATHIALSAAVRGGQRVVYISTEDGRDLFTAREASYFLGIPPREMMFGNVRDMSRLETPASAIPDYDLTFYSDKRQLDDVIAVVEHEALNKADLIILDYVQAIRPPMPSDGMPRVEGDRRLLIGAAAAAVRQIVERYQVTVLLMSQARRMTANEKLTLSHAKEAGELENSADIGILLESVKDARMAHEATLLTVVKHKLPVDSRPWKFQRDYGHGGRFVEVDGGGGRAEPAPEHIWESDDDQTRPWSGPAIGPNGYPKSWDTADAE